MNTDNLGNVIYHEQDVLDLIYKDKENLLPEIYVSDDININDLDIKRYIPSSMDIKEFDIICQNQWIMPDNYRHMDIKSWLYDQVPPWDLANDRISLELTEFEHRNMLDLLRWLKYLIDTARTNNIIWGVGRGSSVSSYVLYLIGVHKIDSIKYNLDFKEFLR